MLHDLQSTVFLATFKLGASANYSSITGLVESFHCPSCSPRIWCTKPNQESGAPIQESGSPRIWCTRPSRPPLTGDFQHRPPFIVDPPQSASSPVPLDFPPQNSLKYLFVPLSCFSDIILLLSEIYIYLSIQQSNRQSIFFVMFELHNYPKLSKCILDHNAIKIWA